jgi:hypothetical protein
MPILADPDLGQAMPTQRGEFYVKVKGHTLVGKKAVLKGWKSGLFVNLGQFPCSPIRIRIPNTDPDPGEPNRCGSGSATLLSILYDNNNYRINQSPFNNLSLPKQQETTLQKICNESYKYTIKK